MESCFPPAYENQGIKIKIKGDNINLDLNQEEMVYQWAKKKDTHICTRQNISKKLYGRFCQNPRFKI